MPRPATRCSDLLVRHVRQLRNAFRKVRTERSFTIDAIVILPDRLHAVGVKRVFHCALVLLDMQFKGR